MDGAFAKQRRLHLVKDRDGLNHCPVTGYEHPGFTSQKCCRKHVKTKHGWYYYLATRSLMYRSTISTLSLLLRMELTKKLGEQFLAALQIINSLVRFRSGFKAAVARGLIS